VFGAYTRRGYAPSEPILGVPLGYQYLLTVRPDAVPASADDVLRQRGAGWRVRYPVGAATPGAGLPLVNAFRWDAGVQARLGSEEGILQASVAVSQGSLSNPRLRDDNGGKQVAARLAARPAGGLVLGLSAARGAYLADTATAAVVAFTGRRMRDRQTGVGCDVEYSRGYWLLRAEAIWARWDVPAVRAPELGRPLGAVAVFAEGRYRLAPGLTLGARAEALRFDRIRGTGGEAPWEAAVTRLEGGVAYALHRHAILKGGYQHDWRDGGFVRAQGFAAAQLLLWF
jgi:hypothetical protein